MKKIGLLGGTSWPSTTIYYKHLNKLTNESIGGFHSARIILWSIDYHEIKSCYYDKWNNIRPLSLKDLRV